MLSFSVPIYYTIEKKTKPSTTHLVSDNWVRNLYPHLKNKVKQHYHQLVADALEGQELPSYAKFRMNLNIYYKTTNCDPSNIAHQIEKYVLDAIKELQVIVDDNVKFHVSTTWNTATQDKSNPRCEVQIEGLS